MPVAGATASSAASDLWREWDVLAERLDAPPFLRPGWFRAWHGAYGDGELRLLSVRRGDELAGVLPVEIKGTATLSPTNTHTPLYGPVADGAEMESALVRELLELAKGRIELAYADPGARWFSLLRDALPGTRRSDRRSVMVETITRPPYVSTAGGWDAYRAERSRKFMKELGRQRRRLAEQGALELAVHTSVDGVQAALDEFVALESSGWKAAEGTAIGSRDASRRFYSELARWLAERGWLRLAFLRLDGRAIAAELDIACAGALYSLKSGFDTEYRAFGPGQLLTHDCVKLAFDDGLASYEFLGTDEAYKMSWTASTRERARVRSFPRTVSGDLSAVARHYGRPMVRRLRRG
ncbi:MAG TPA: GNAT family N-acetyltransferase [Thermoleophilaceae bacterium]|nr:GNAT family N-acetyltransferase [Thermoleophilaceae bacterium]